MPPDRPQRVTLPTLQILAAVADLAVLDLGEGALGTSTGFLGVPVVTAAKLRI
jgi:hypothetical protein